MATLRRRSARWAYENAITDFSDASAGLYVRAASGTPPATPEELARYANAKIHLEIRRQVNEDALWF